MTRLSKKAGITTMGKKSAKKKEKPGARADAHGRGKVATSGKKKKQPAVLTEEQIKMITQRRKITKAILEKQKSLEKEREKKKKEKEKEKKKKAGHPAAIEDLFSEKKKTKKKDKHKAEDREKKAKKEGKKEKESGVILPASWEKLEGYVPPQLEKVADRVLDHYDLKPKSRVVVATKPLKGGAIWQVTTEKGRHYSLKLLHRRPERSLFSIWAQEYLVKKKARVPAFLPTKDDRLYVEMGNKLWIVCEWIESLREATKDLKGAQAICYGLGEFHRLSRGYQPPAEAEYSSRLRRWPDYYEKIITKFGWFRRLGEAYRDTPAGPELLKALAVFEKQAHEGLARLQRSPYARLAARGESYWGLAHQDYGWGNAQIGPGGVWIIDLDGVVFDLPIRDLRKLISSCMDEKWDLQWVKGMISAYHKANPIEPDLYEVFLIDLAMPNEFYQFIKEVVYDPVTFLNAGTKNELTRMIQREKSKRSVLAALSDWKVGKE